jgi:hypothetical protein
VQAIAKFIKKIIGKIRNFGQAVLEKGKQLLGIGKKVNFSDGQESHQLSIKLQGARATVMVASGSPTPVRERLNEWKSNKNKPEGTQPLIAQADNLFSQIDKKAAPLATKIENKTPFNAEDKRTSEAIEALEEQLAPVLAQLFEKYGEAGLSDEQRTQVTSTLTGLANAATTAAKNLTESDYSAKERVQFKDKGRGFGAYRAAFGKKAHEQLARRGAANKTITDLNIDVVYAGIKGPDFAYKSGYWWDLTSANKWPEHVAKYTNYGQGTLIPYPADAWQFPAWFFALRGEEGETSEGDKGELE